MSYTKETQITPAMEAERDLLIAGFSYSEISHITGNKLNTIKERNRIIHRINIRDAFRNRIERDGIIKRNTVSDNFGYWFSGYFDGEGCLTVFYRERFGIPDKRVGIQISCRYDDADIIAYIYDTLKVGVVWRSKIKGATNEAMNWRVESASDLTEVILPIFDAYPLRSKKRLEYLIWRELVINQYANTLGGTSTRVGATKEENAAFQFAMQKIRDIRHPVSRTGLSLT